MWKGITPIAATTLALTIPVLPADAFKRNDPLQDTAVQSAGPTGDNVREESAVPGGHGKVQVGAPSFDFTATSLAGEDVRLSAFAGRKVVLLQFWGIRCRPCLDEIDFLGGLQQQYGSQGLQVIGVNTDQVAGDRLATAMRARDLDLPYPIVLDPGLRIAQRYTSSFIPVTVLIDVDGVVQAVHTGYTRGLDTTISGEVEGLLERSRPDRPETVGMTKNRFDSLREADG
jgi:peroxiredoxin